VCCGSSSEQASAKLGEHRKIKAGIGQFEIEGVFPIDAFSHALGGLPI
jgi:hypothetical protein